MGTDLDTLLRTNSVSFRPFGLTRKISNPNIRRRSKSDLTLQLKSSRKVAKSNLRKKLFENRGNGELTGFGYHQDASLYIPIHHLGGCR